MTKKIWLYILMAAVLLASACALLPGGKDASPADDPGDAPGETIDQEGGEGSEADLAILGEVEWVQDGGFGFGAIPGYDLNISGGMVTMTAPGADADTGPVVQLIGWADGVEKTPEQLLEELVSGMDMEAGPAKEIMIDGARALEVDVAGETAGVPMLGRFAFTSIMSGQHFVLMAGAPEAEWEELVPLYDAVMASVQFTPVSAGPVSSDLESGITAYTNKNVVRDVVVYQDRAYAATLGGMVAWDLQSSYPMVYTTIQGMGHVSANAIVVCDVPETRVVVGTLQGLSLYDPSTGLWDYQQLLPEDHALNTSKITRLYCDQANNRLLIGARGLSVLDLATGEVQRYTTDEGLAWNEVRDITVSGSSIWVASGTKGLALISNGNITTYTAENGLPDERVNAVQVAGDGTIWAGASSGIMSFRSGSWTLYGSETPARLASISEIEIAADGKIWVATAPLGSGRLCQFNPSDATCAVEYSESDSQPILALDLNEGMPVYGTSRGLNIFDNGSVYAYQTADQLASNYVDSFAMDTNDRLWVGTDGGIQIVETWNMEGDWTTFTRSETPGLGGSWGSGIAVGPNGDVWVAVINGEASRYQGGSWTSFEDIYSFNVVAVDGEGRAWFGDDNKGIVVMNADGSLAMTLTTAEGLPTDRVHALLSDASGVMWIGTDEGLMKYEQGNLVTVLASDDPGLPNRIIRDLAWASDGSLIIGTFTGVSRYDGSQAELVLDFLKDGFSQARLTTVAASPSGRVWAGTDKGLLYSDDLVQWTMLTTEDGLLTNYISALLADRYGAVWVGGGGSNFDGGGILRLVP